MKPPFNYSSAIWFFWMDKNLCILFYTKLFCVLTPFSISSILIWSKIDYIFKIFWNSLPKLMTSLTIVLALALQKTIVITEIGKTNMIRRETWILYLTLGSWVGVLDKVGLKVKAFQFCTSTIEIVFLNNSEYRGHNC